VSRRHRSDFVLPDIEDFRVVFEFLRLRNAHPRGKTVQAVAEVVDFLRTGAGFT